MAGPRMVISEPAWSAPHLPGSCRIRGWGDVTVLDQGRWFVTGGSSTHAPGLVFLRNSSKTTTEFAR
jgi:hypothetical protein